jgi:MarR family transcriptional regulator, transcriptional regulator for hemolysin
VGDNTSRGIGVEGDSGRSLEAALDGALLRVARFLIDPPGSALTGIPFAQARCLQVVGRLEGQKMHDLAQSLEIKLPAVSQIVERLVQQGLLERRSDPQDRRVARVWLTSTARRLLEEARRARESRLSAALERLGPEAASRLVADLERLATATDTPGVSSLESADPVADLLARRARQRRPWSESPRIE